MSVNKHRPLQASVQQACALHGGGGGGKPTIVFRIPAHRRIGGADGKKRAADRAGPGATLMVSCSLGLVERLPVGPRLPLHPLLGGQLHGLLHLLVPLGQLPIEHVHPGAIAQARPLGLHASGGVG